VNRRLISVAAALLAGAIGSILLGFNRSVAAIQLQDVQLPGGGSFTVDQPGTWMLWRGVLGGAAIPADQVASWSRPQAVAPSGEVLQSGPTTRQIRFTRADEPMVVEGGVTLGPKGWLTVARFDIETPGDWTLQGAPGDWALSPDPLGAVKWWALGSTSVAIALVGAAACTGWIALKRPQGGPGVQLGTSRTARGG